MRPDETIECCELMYVHKDIVEKVREEMPDEEELYDLAELFLSCRIEW